MEKKKISAICLAVLCAGILLEHMPLLAGTTGKISGRITEAQTGTPLPGANVFVEGTGLGAATDSRGQFTILNIPPGIYTLQVKMMGYRSVVMKSVRTNIDLTTTINSAMEPTVLEISEQVTVVAERPFVQKDMTSALTTVNSREIEMLPVQTINDVLELQAGMIRDGNDFHIRGGRTGEVAYWIDGVSATDVYNGGMGVTVENSAIAELQVISGTYNAEYGQAMSGIVNIVTKEGGPKYTGQLKAYAGDYLSTNSVYDVLKNVKSVTDSSTNATGIKTEEENPLSKFNPVYNLEANLSGPVPFYGDKLSFFANGRYVTDEGFQYGRRWFKPQSIPGDSALVPMNQYTTLSAQGKLTFKMSTHMKLSYNVLWNRFDQDRSSSFLFKYNPDGTPQQHSQAMTHILSWNHVLSHSAFYEARVTRFYREYKQYVYKDAGKTPHYLVQVHGASGDYQINPDTPDGATEFQQVKLDQVPFDYVVDPNDADGYIHPDSLKAPTGYSFYRGGMDMSHLSRSTAYWIGKIDLTSQLSQVQQVKIGMEFRLHELTLNRFDILPKLTGGEQVVPFAPWVPPVSSPYRDQYNRKPRELSAYFQDKMEFDDLIVNTGLRFDYFDANSVIPADPADPDVYNPIRDENIYKTLTDSVKYTLAEKRSRMQKKVDAKMKLSPRLGIAYPVTDRGAIHFSYGHFFQIPEFQYLYEGADFKLVHGGLSTVMGNADLQPQRTVMYEIGLQQQLTDNIGIDFTVFYRDIRNWVGTSPVIKTASPTTSYVKFENKDYSNVRGFTLKLEKRYSRYYSARLDYTYQVAEGTYSNPRDAFYSYQSQREPRLALIPLGWDQRQTLNGYLTFDINSWILTFQGKYRTGRPYTPSIPKGELVGGAALKDLEDNSERLPTIASLDMYVNKRFNYGRFEYTFFVYVYNLLDSKGETNVYSDTGTAEYTTTIDPADISYSAARIGTIHDYLRHPDWYIAPRHIQIGMTLGF